jgi:hypothetical protein
MDTSGGRERLFARIARMAERLRSNPNWREPTESEADAIKLRLKEYFATKVNGV